LELAFVKAKVVNGYKKIQDTLQSETMTIENIGGVEIGDGDGDATMEENFEDGDTNDVLD